MKLTKIGEFLKRSKIPLDILDDEHYNRVTIRINHNGVSLRDNEIGKKIGTKKQFILKSGQFILSKIDARYGAFGIAPDEVEGSIITGNFWAYDVDKMKVNIEWFNQFTNSPVFYEVCERASSGITHRKYLDEKFFLNYEILLPSVEEQLSQIEKIKEQKISFGELSTELTYQLALVKKLRQQLLQDAVQGKLVPQNPNDDSASELLKKIKAEKLKLIAEKKLKKEKEVTLINSVVVPFDIPSNWKWCSLGELAILNARIGWKGLNASEYKKEGPLFLSVHSLNYGDYVDYAQAFHISQERYDESPEIMLKNNDILICKDGAGIGKLGIVKDLKEQATTNSSLLVIRCFNNLHVKFIYYYLISEHFQRIVNAKIMGATTPHLYQRDLVHFYVALPPLAEQHRIVQKLDELMQACDALEASIKESAAQNENLLQQVLREALRKV